MKKVIAFGTSNSSTSINKKFAQWAAEQITGIELQVIDLNDYEMPLYNPDLERESGFPNTTLELKKTLDSAEAFVISLAEYNGNYTPVFKNAQDWISRIDKNIWNNKPVLLLSSSPGRLGGASALSIAQNSFPRMGANIIASFSLPEFNKNFEEGKGIVDPDIASSFLIELNKFQEEMN